MLGAWIGNKADGQAPWEPIIDKVKTNLKKWAKIRPTLEGKCQIIQAIVGGHTQFLSQAQGMPTQIEDAITKIISDFIWEDGLGTRIAQETLNQPWELGGLSTLNIHAWNDAIDLMWLKSYLNFTPNCQPWAAITDLILDIAAPKDTEKQARNNQFLQCWNTPSRGIRADKINDDISRMLKAARTHNTNLAVVKISPHL